MTKHELVEIAERRGQKETAFTAHCSCGWMGPDQIALLGTAQIEAQRRARRDHKLHAEGKDPNRAPDDAPNPGVRGWAERIEREGR